MQFIIGTNARTKRLCAFPVAMSYIEEAPPLEQHAEREGGKLQYKTIIHFGGKPHLLLESFEDLTGIRSKKDIVP